MNAKIIFIASYPESLINFRLHLIREFLNRKYAVVVIAPHDENVMSQLSSLGVNYIHTKVERNGLNPFNDLLFIAKLYRLIRRERPRFIFSYTIKPVIYGTLAAKLAGVREIYSMLTGTGYVFYKRNLKNRFIGIIAKTMFRISLRFNKKCFFQNKDNLASFLTDRLISKKQPVAVINGSGVDINHFSPAMLPKTISFLMISRFLNDKGIREYIAAARLIKHRYPEVTFKLVGWIDTNPNSITENELSQWIEEGTIDYLGKLSDVRHSIANASVYVLPSYGEGTPRTVLEAMAMARPIITTDAPGCRETVINEYNGFLVPVRSVDSLCQAMEYFITHPEAIEKMGRASRTIALEKYDVNKVNHCILNEMGVS